MLYEFVSSYAHIIIPIVAALIYLIAYTKLQWGFLWIGFAGACINVVSGFDVVYASIDYDNMETIDYFIDTLWVVGWTLEVICLYLIVNKVVEVQSQLQKDNDNPVMR